MLLASALSVAVAALVAPNTPTAQANLPVERASSHHKARVHQVKVDPRLFGVHDYFENSLHRSGTGSIRLWDSGTQWGDLFSDPDTPDWTRLDALVTQAHENGTEVLLVLGLTPKFAAPDPTDPDYATKMPDLSLYSAYVRAVMAHYSPANWGYRGIAAYQVWNEGNITTFWNSSRDDLAELTKAVHDVRDDVDPGATVVGPAMVTRLGYEQGGLQKFYATRVGGKPVWKYVDAISLNLYPLDRYPIKHPTRPGTPEDSMALLSTVKRLLAKDKVPGSIPIWNTEVNYGLRSGANGGKAAAPVSNSVQVAYVIRTFLLNAARGVKRVDWYAYDMSQRGDLGPLGNTLLTDPVDRAAGTLRPAGIAFSRVQQWLKGGVLVGTTTKRPCITDRHGTYTCLIKYRTGVARVYWNPYQRAKVTVARTATRKVDEFGRTTSAKGGATLRVNYRPVLVKSKK